VLYAIAPLSVYHTDGSVRVGKIRNFQPISRRISETVQDRTKVRLLLMTNRKTRMRFRLVTKSIALDDFEL